ncbi:MAG: hypothetical protein EAZ85_04365 [Bacteroidetes bacterium]|nr:MAG: hypothetical protein EAZ85_04365 [Bacteroidota bacterium]TAG88415.1 MAG: hypothetical protein EAZ20_08595 [Bacteroidota bacterium]
MQKITFFLKNNWKTITISFAVLLIGVGLYFWRQAYKIEGAWVYIPQPAIFVLETDDAIKTWKDFEKQNIGKWFSQTNYGNIVNERVNLLSSQNQFSFFQNRPCTISGHLISSQEMDILFTIPCNQKEKKDIETKLAQLISLTKTKIFTRNYKGFSLQEIIIDNNSLTWFWENDYLLISFSPVILEDVARRLSENDKNLAIPSANILKKISFKNNQNTKLYVNTSQINLIAKWISPEDKISFFNPIQQIAQAMIWQSADNSFKNWVGKIDIEDKNNLAYHKIWEGQQTNNFSLGNVISDKTSILWYFNYSNATNFWENYQIFQKNEKNIHSKLKKLLDKEWALSWLETDNVDKLGQIIYLKSSQSDAVLKYFDEINKNQNIQGKYGKFIFSEISQSEFPAQIFGSWINGFSRTYYAKVEDCVVLVNNLEVLKKYFDDIAKKKTLQKAYSHLQDLWLKNPKNFRLSINPTKLMPLITQNVLENWYTWFENHDELITNTDWWTIASKTENQNTEFSLVLDINWSKKNTKTEKVPVAYHSLWKINTSDIISTSLFEVKNHTSNEKEWLCQDVKNNLYLLSNKGNLLFKTNIGGTLRSKPIQIDIYNNQRLQYLFITSRAVNLYDRLGQSVAGFPYSLPQERSPLKNFSYLDINLNQKEHYLLSTERGQVYILDEKRSFLPEWKPKKLDFRLGASPQIAQMRKQSYLIFGQEDGFVQVFDKKGIAVKNFPIKMEGKISNEIFAENGADEKNTFFTILSDLGELKTYNLLGQKVADKAILRISNKSKLKMCISQDKKTYFPVVLDYNIVSIYEKNGEKLFEKKYKSNSSAFEVQFFDLDMNQKIIAITDKADNKTYLYDLEGNQMAEPFPSSRGIEMAIENGSLIIYYVFQKTIGALELKGI